MKKYFPFISFILILSFVLPFFPCFSLSAKAEDSVSSDDAYINWKKDNIDAIRNGLADNGLVINNDYYSDQYYYVDPEDNLWRDILRQWGLDGTDYGKPLSRVAYDYAVSNNINNTQIYNDCFDSVYNYVNSNVPYYIYHSMPVSEFFSYFLFNPNGESLQSVRNFLVGHVNNDIDYLSGFFSQSFLGDSYCVLVDYSDVVSSNSLCLYGNGSFDNYPNYPYQTYIHTSVSTTEPYPFSILKFYSHELFSVYDSTFTCWTFTNNTGHLTGDSYSHVGFVQNSYYPSNYHNCYGTIYLSPDSVGSVSFPVFKSATDLQLFYTGRSNVYAFDTDIDITGQDLDLSKLYDVIRKTVSDSKGDIITAINDVANDYLAQQVELLGDINNALNDSFGRSWLRIISGQLDDFFPRTLVKLDALVDALSHISGGGSGGVADLTNIEDDLSIIKGLLILQTAHDIIDDLKNNNVHNNDFNDVVTVANTKFPFSIPNDIVTILGLFVAEPTEPEFVFPVPFSNNHETFDIDISFIGSSLPYIRGAFIILFILFLVVVSVKVVNSLKE